MSRGRLVRGVGRPFGAGVRGPFRPKRKLPYFGALPIPPGNVVEDVTVGTLTTEWGRVGTTWGAVIGNSGTCSGLSDAFNEDGVQAVLHETFANSAKYMQISRSECGETDFATRVTNLMEWVEDLNMTGAQRLNFKYWCVCAEGNTPEAEELLNATKLARMVAARDIIKSYHPNAVVFATIQWETAEAEGNTANLVEVMETNFDALGITTYPFTSLPSNNPNLLGEAYYRNLRATGARAPIIVGECGWPSASNGSQSGTQSGQSTLLTNLTTAMLAVGQCELVNWFFSSDAVWWAVLTGDARWYDHGLLLANGSTKTITSNFTTRVTAGGTRPLI